MKKRLLPSFAAGFTAALYFAIVLPVQTYLACVEAPAFSLGDLLREFALYFGLAWIAASATLFALSYVPLPKRPSRRMAGVTGRYRCSSTCWLSPLSSRRSLSQVRFPSGCPSSTEISRAIACRWSRDPPAARPRRKRPRRREMSFKTISCGLCWLRGR